MSTFDELKGKYIRIGNERQWFPYQIGSQITPGYFRVFLLNAEGKPVSEYVESAKALFGLNRRLFDSFDAVMDRSIVGVSNEPR